MTKTRDILCTVLIGACSLFFFPNPANAAEYRLCQEYFAERLATFGSLSMGADGAVSSRLGYASSKTGNPETHVLNPDQDSLARVVRIFKDAQNRVTRIETDAVADPTAAKEVAAFYARYARYPEVAAKLARGERDFEEKTVPWMTIHELRYGAGGECYPYEQVVRLREENSGRTHDFLLFNSRMCFFLKRYYNKRPEAKAMTCASAGVEASLKKHIETYQAAPQPGGPTRYLWDPSSPTCAVAATMVQRCGAILAIGATLSEEYLFPAKK